MRYEFNYQLVVEIPKFFEEAFFVPQDEETELFFQMTVFHHTAVEGDHHFD